MNSRSKKYYQGRKEASGEKKGSVTEAGYNEENETTSKQFPKINPAPPKSAEDPKAATLSSQGDSTGKEKDHAG
ncbi:MAG: hypothetical protein ABI416_01400 [Ginsengibacter sp.]